MFALADGFDDARERFDGTDRAVYLLAAVVGDHHSIDMVGG